VDVSDRRIVVAALGVISLVACGWLVELLARV
jgi:hypothetical protein